MRLQKTIVVVEIGADWLKIAESNPSSHADSEISKIHIQKLTQAKEEIPAAISNAFKELKLHKDSVILCMPRYLVTVRTLELPSVNPKEIDDMINLQIGKQTPYSKEEIVSTYKTTRSIKEGYTKAILVIAHRSQITERVESLRRAGIEAVKLSISSEGVYNWFSISYLPAIKVSDSESTVLIDIDSNYSDFIVLRGADMVFTKHILIGADHLSDTPWRDKLVEESKRCVKQYYMAERNTKLSKVYLSGATNGLEGLDISLTHGLDMVVERTEPFKNIKIAAGVKASQNQNVKRVSFTPLIGMAARYSSLKLDLTSSEQKVLKLMQTKGKDLTIMGILFLSIVMVSSLLLGISLYYKSAYLKQLKSEVTKISGDSVQIETMRSAIALVQNNLDARGSSLDTLREIYKITPSEIYFTTIDIDENKEVILKGRGLAMSDVFKFVKKLEESPMFEGAKASYTRVRKEKEGDKEVEYAEFEIVCHYEKRQ